LPTSDAAVRGYPASGSSCGEGRGARGWGTWGRRCGPRDQVGPDRAGSGAFRRCSVLQTTSETAPETRLHHGGYSTEVTPSWNMLSCPPIARSVVLLAGLTAGCGAGWHRIEDPAVAQLPVRQQVQVWTAGRNVRLHAVRLVGDSLIGIPFHRSPDCDSCRVAIAVTAIDSVRAGNPEAGFWKTLGLIGLINAALLAWFCAEGGCTST
jgi:hypothetical protein